MFISEGERGPLFKVIVDGGREYVGNTPTYPWTQICIQSKSPGTRVSGPLVVTLIRAYYTLITHCVVLWVFRSASSIITLSYV